MNDKLANFLLGVAGWAGIEDVRIYEHYIPNGGIPGGTFLALVVPSMRDFLRLMVRAADAYPTIKSDGSLQKQILDFADNYRTNNLGHDIVVF